MTPKQFFDWQTAGGTNDVMLLVDSLERADIPWCAIGGIAVNHWAAQAMVTQDVDIVVAFANVEQALQLLGSVGFHIERFAWSINLQGDSSVSIQISTEEFYREFPARAVPADVHGILLRVASLEDTLAGKIRAWSDPERRQSKRIKDLADIVRLLETYPALWDRLNEEIKAHIKRQEQGA